MYLLVRLYVSEVWLCFFDFATDCACTSWLRFQIVLTWNLLQKPNDNHNNYYRWCAYFIIQFFVFFLYVTKCIKREGDPLWLYVYGPQQHPCCALQFLFILSLFHPSFSFPSMTEQCPKLSDSNIAWLHSCLTDGSFFLMWKLFLRVCVNVYVCWSAMLHAAHLPLERPDTRWLQKDSMKVFSLNWWIF